MRETVWRTAHDHCRGAIRIRRRALRAAGLSHLAGDAPHSSITIAAFAPGMVKLAAEIADRVVLNLVTPDQVARMRGAIDRAARASRSQTSAGHRVGAGCVRPDRRAWRQLARQLVVYVGAPGYGEMFMKPDSPTPCASHEAAVHPRVLLASIPRALMQAIGAIGS
jgi:alkanesulfonate monooxygenase SsuD/methylene tetrahydromethanopterin reductase-like flavin-dependent oxidoreductase (luciferase family)